MDAFLLTLGYGNFLIVLVILVFVHEMGHYLAARRAGVRVEAFSIGIGPEIAGWTDGRGTRWRLAALPLGGYVRMAGEGFSPEEAEKSLGRPLTADERRVAFAYRPLWRRAWIVAAGPAANFLFAICVFAVLFMTVGPPTPGDITVDGIAAVAPDSAAAAAGFQIGDRILRVDGVALTQFSDLVQSIQASAGRVLTFDVQRAGTLLTLQAAPRREADEATAYRLGISAPSAVFQRLGLSEALWYGARETVVVTGLILREIGRLLVGDGDLEELGGPVRIAQMSNDVGAHGAFALAGFIALLSINLGLINLLPIPVLDGGHLLFYGVEAVMGRPVPVAVRETGVRIGLGALLTLMVFLTVNDILRF